MFLFVSVFSFSFLYFILFNLFYVFSLSFLMTARLLLLWNQTNPHIEVSMIQLPITPVLSQSSGGRAPLPLGRGLPRPGASLLTSRIAHLRYSQLPEVKVLLDTFSQLLQGLALNVFEAAMTHHPRHVHSTEGPALRPEPNSWSAN